MTNTSPGSGKPPQAASINDNLPSGNPPLKVVLAVFGCFALIVFVLVFHASLGF